LIYILIENNNLIAFLTVVDLVGESIRGRLITSHAGIVQLEPKEHVMSLTYLGLDSNCSLKR